MPEQQRAKLAANARTILLVEDEASLRKLTRKTLLDMGYVVLEAGNAEEAIRLANTSSGAIHVLLTDVIMPGMSGGDLAKKLSAELPGLRVLFMSGYTDGAIEVRGNLKAGLVVLRKPFTRDVLLRAIEDAITAPANPAESDESSTPTAAHTVAN